MTALDGQQDDRDGPPAAAGGRRAGSHRPVRHRRPRSWLRGRALAVALLVAGVIGLAPEGSPLPTESPAAADDCEGMRDSSAGGEFYNNLGCSTPGGSQSPPDPAPDPDPPPSGNGGNGGDGGNGGNGGGNDDGGGSSEPVCRYIRLEDPDLAVTVYRQAGLEIPGGYPYLDSCADVDIGGTLGIEHMSNIAGLYSPDDFVFIYEDFDYGINAVLTGVPLETELLNTAWAEVEGQLGEPEPVVYPPSGTPTLVGVPTLLSVENPQEEIVYGPNCADPPADDVCVSVTATPSLTFDPGDGTDPVSCDPAGTSFDPDGPPVSEQAEGGCAHAYSYVSDADGYPGRLSLTWEVYWENSLGESGEFDPITLPEGDEPNVTRVVQELHAVVDEVGPGGSSR